jgi:hypothetical protein
LGFNERLVNEAGGVDGPGGDLLDILDELGLGPPGVAAQEDVDVTTDTMLVQLVLGLASE